MEIGDGYRVAKYGLILLSLVLQAFGIEAVRPDTNAMGLWRTFAQTAPLTISLALMIAHIGELRSMNDIWPFLFFSMIILGISTAVAVRFGHLNIFDKPDLVDPALGRSVLVVPVNLVNWLHGYFTAYGPVKFCSSIVLAIAIVVAVSRSETKS